MADAVEVTPLTKEQWKEKIMGASAQAFRREEHADVEKIAAYLAALEVAMFQAIRDFSFILVESTDLIVVETAVEARATLMNLLLDHHS